MITISEAMANSIHNYVDLRFNSHFSGDAIVNFLESKQIRQVEYFNRRRTKVDCINEKSV